MIDPTECETLGRRSARRSNRRVEGCKELYKNSYNLPGALAKGVIFAIEPVGTRATNAIKPAGAPRREQGSEQPAGLLLCAANKAAEAFRRRLCVFIK